MLGSKVKERSLREEGEERRRSEEGEEPRKGGWSGGEDVCNDPPKLLTTDTHKVINEYTVWPKFENCIILYYIVSNPVNPKFTLTSLSMASSPSIELRLSLRRVREGRCLLVLIDSCALAFCRLLSSRSVSGTASVRSDGAENTPKFIS